MPNQNTISSTNPSFISMLIKWWIINTPKNIWFGTIQIIENTFHFFSIPQLVKTLFEPWRRDSIEAINLSLQQRLQLWVMNLVSRFIGFLIRSITIFTAFVIIIIEFIVGFIWLFVFMLAPFIGLTFFIYSFL